MVQTSDVQVWKPEFPGHTMNTHEIRRHLAYLKHLTGDSWEEIGRSLHLSDSRCGEIVNNPETVVRPAKRKEVTAAALGRFPIGVPMVRVYVYPGEAPSANVERAFGPQSYLTQEQALIPRPEPIVLGPDDVGLGGRNFRPVLSRKLAPEDEYQERVRALQQSLKDMAVVNARSTADLAGTRAELSRLAALNEDLATELEELRAFKAGVIGLVNGSTWAGEEHEGD